MKKMTKAEIIDTITELKEMERFAEEISEAIETMKDQLKAEMGESEELIAGPYKVTWKTITSVKLSTTAIKKAFPEAALQPYMVSSTCRRFCIN
jgi:predicted phage-related endonuclease